MPARAGIGGGIANPDITVLVDNHTQKFRAGDKIERAFGCRRAADVSGFEIHVAALVSDIGEAVPPRKEVRAVAVVARSHAADKEPEGSIHIARRAGADINKVVGRRRSLIEQHAAAGFDPPVDGEGIARRCRADTQIPGGGIGEGGFRREGAAGVELHAAVGGGGGGSGGDDVGPRAGLIALKLSGLGVVTDHAVDGGSGALGRRAARGDHRARSRDVELRLRRVRADADVAGGGNAHSLDKAGVKNQIICANVVPVSKNAC